MSVELWGSAVKPVQAAPQRWTGVIKPTRRLLETWPAIKAAIGGYKDKMVNKYGAESRQAKAAAVKVDALKRLNRNRQALMEHLALLQGVHSVIADAQYLHVPAGAHSHMLMISERLSTFNTVKPLSVKQYTDDGK